MKGSNYRDHQDRAENRGKPGKEEHKQTGDQVKGEDESGIDRSIAQQIVDPKEAPVPSEHGGEGAPGQPRRG